MNSFEYTALASYLEFVCQTYQLQICFKDFVGFIAVDKDLDKVLQPFMAHTNPYCMSIKSDKTLYTHKCRVFKKPIAQKCIKLAKPFYGVCHAGVSEYIIPIKNAEQCIGAICVGIFKTDHRLAEYLVKRTCRNSTLQGEQIFEKYQQLLCEPPPDLAVIANHLQIVAEYLGNIFTKAKSTHMEFKFVKKLYNSRENSILAHTLEYIKQNYAEPITVNQIAGFCYCSETYINHIFKKRMGTNIKMYINIIRVEQAKNLLVNTNQNIANIALKVGFNDPNYFTRVFTATSGESPTEYKRRYTIHSEPLPNKKATRR
jgi:AraC-like DNA-binding protein/ligand-binding sensor protein